MTGAKVEGTVAPGYESVKKVFTKIMNSGSEEHLQVCAYVRGEKVVDLWASSKSSSDSDYDGDSLQNVFSSTKTVAAFCMACLVDKGLLDYDDLVSKHWPEFAQNGKENIKVCDVLRHESGLGNFKASLSQEDFSREGIKRNQVGKVIEESVPRYPPENFGSLRSYHGITRGWILNEIFRRVEPSGRTMGEFFEEEIRKKLDADIFIGVPEDKMAKVKDIKAWGISHVLYQPKSIWPEWLGRRIETGILDFIKVTTMFMKNAGGHGQEPKPPPNFKGLDGSKMESFMKMFNAMQTRKGEIPSANGHCSARGMAKLATLMANKGSFDGTELVSPDTMHKMMDKVEERKDHMLGGVKTAFSQGGINFFDFEEGSRAPKGNLAYLREGFRGWMGLGGSVLMFHDELNIGFGYCGTQIQWYELGNTRGARLQNEVVKCVRNLN